MTTARDFHARLTELLAETEGMVPGTWNPEAVAKLYGRASERNARGICALHNGIPTLRDLATYLGREAPMGEIERLVDAALKAAGEEFPGSEREATARTALLDAIRAVLRDAPLTVGAALALLQVQDGSHVVEFLDGGLWRQMKPLRGRAVEIRRFFRSAWFSWISTAVDNDDGAEVWGEDYALPCRLVALADADLPPETRGPL